MNSATSAFTEKAADGARGRPKTRTAARRAVRGAIVGNFADQFDIFLPVIALAPASEELFGGSVVLAAAWVFVATLLGRPVGALVFGPIADRVGRARVTRLVLAGVAVTTCAIAFVPGHRVLGVGTLLAVIVLRFLGGVFLGGEYTAAIPLAMQWTRPERRAALSGAIMAMSPLANAVIAAAVTSLLAIAGPAAYASMLWRIVFVVGALSALAARLTYGRAVDMEIARTSTAAPTASALRTVLFGPSRRALFRSFVLMTGLWTLTDMSVPALTAHLGSLPTMAPSVPVVMLIATAVSALGIASAGAIAGRVGYRRFFIAVGVIAAVATPALFVAIDGVASAGNLAGVAGLAALLQLATVSGYGPVGAFLSRQFPSSSRSTGYGAAYSLSIVLPALYPYYLPALQHAIGASAAVAALLALGGLLVLIGGALEPLPSFTRNAAALTRNGAMQ